MLRYGFEIYQQLIKMFVRTNKRFPNEKETKFLQNQALRVREGLFDRGVNMEKLNAEDAIKVFSQPPKRRKRPTAEIYKPLEFGKKSKPKEGLEALDEAKVFDQFRDENTLMNLYRTQEQALAGGDIDTSRKIQKQIDAIINKEPLSDFADGGRVGMAAGGIAVLKSLLNFLAKGRGKKGSQLLQEVNPKKYGTTLENLMLPDDKKMVKGFRVEYLESLLDTIKTDKAMLDKMKSMPIDQREAFFDMINQGMNRGRLDVYKKIDPDEAILEIEQMIKNLKFKDVPEQEIKRQLNADGGRVGMMAGGITKIKKLLDLAKKTKSKLGEASKTDLKKVRAKAASDKKSTEELAKSEQIPVRDDTVKKDLNRQLTDDEIDDLVGDVGDLDAYDFDGTVASANRIRKEYKDYMDDMYRQYKAGKLDPSPGEVSRSRMKYLQDKQQEAEMTDDFRLFTPDEADELSNLEQRFEYLDLTEKAQNVSRPLSNDDIQKLKEFDDMGFADVLKALDRTKKRDGGLATLFEERG